MLRYYFDEHVEAAIAEQLRLRGVDVLRAQDVGRAGRKIPDPEQLVYATTAGRVSVSIDRDFIVLSSTHIPHAEIILLQRPLAIGQYVEYLELMAKATEADGMHNQLVYCDC